MKDLQKQKVYDHIQSLIDNCRVERKKLDNGLILMIHYKIFFYDTIRLIKNLRSGLYKLNN